MAKEWWYPESGKGEEQPVVTLDGLGPPGVVLPDGTLLQCENKAAARTVAQVLRLLVVQQRAPSERPSAEDPDEAALEFFEALLRVAYPGRAVAVTLDPPAEDSTEPLGAIRVLCVTVGPLSTDPTWTSFHCNVNQEMRRRDWCGAARALLDAVTKQFERWGTFHQGRGSPRAIP